MNLFCRVSALTLLLTPLSLSAATRTWSGAVSSTWSNPGNWGGTAPAAGDDLTFPAAASNLNNTNDFPPGTEFRSITIGDVYTIGGNAILLGTGGLTSVSQAATISLPLMLGAPQTWSQSHTGTTASLMLEISGDIQLNGHTLTLSGGAYPSFAKITGTIGGTGLVIKEGANLWFIDGSNTYSGQTHVTGGYVVVRNANALGVADDTTGNDTIVSQGTLFIGNLVLAPERIKLFDRISGHGGSSTLTGTLDLAGPNARIYNEVEVMTIAGKITGSGRMGMEGSGECILSNAANDFTGDLVWLGINTRLRLGVDHALPSHVKARLGYSNDWFLDGYSQTISSLASDADGLVFMGGGTLTITGPDSTTFRGNIRDTGTVHLTGGKLTLVNQNTLVGTIQNDGGTLLIVGGSIVAALTQTNGTFGIASGGKAGVVTIDGGTFSPGMGGTGTGRSGSVSLASAAIYEERIDGTTTGSFGTVQVTGSVTLGGASLHLVGSGTGVELGNSLTLIDNDGADAVVGTFAGMPEGTTIPGGPGNYNYTVTYTGETGNDVVLTAATAPTASALISSPNPSEEHRAATFTATVTALAGTGTPAGTVTFFDGAVALATIPLSGGSASFSSNSLALGTHTISAAYNGDAGYLPSTSIPVAHAVGPASPANVPLLDPRSLAALILAVSFIALAFLRH